MFEISIKITCIFSSLDSSVLTQGLQLIT